jgi:hypothetical protein
MTLRLVGVVGASVGLATNVYGTLGIGMLKGTSPPVRRR